MILSGHQPVYLPSLHLLHKVAASDVFMVVEGVAFQPKSWQSRNRVRTREGWTWLTVPVRVHGRRGQLIRDVALNPDVDWRRKHWRTIELLYGRAPYFSRFAPALHDVYTHTWTHLAPLDRALLDLLLGATGVRTPVLVDSDHALAGHGTARVLAMCRAAGATTYLSSAGERAYHDEAAFAAAGIAHGYQSFATPRYAQCFPGFVPDLSALDALLCVGPDAVAAMVAPAARRSVRCPPPLMAHTSW